MNDGNLYPFAKLADIAYKAPLVTADTIAEKVPGYTLLQQPADRALVIIDAELRRDDALEVHPAPAHHAVHALVRTGLDECGQARKLSRRQPRRNIPPPIVLETVRPAFIEPVHPVPQRLAVHAADLRRRRPVHAVTHRGQR